VQRGSHLHGPADLADDASRRRSKLGRSRSELQDEDERQADSGLVEFLLGYGAEAGESAPPLEETKPARRPPPLYRPAPETGRRRYRTRRFRQLLVLGLIAVAAVAAVGFLEWTSGSDGPFTARAPQKPAQAQKQVFRPPAARVVAAASPERSPDAVPGAPVPVARPAVTRVAVHAVRGTSWVVARRGSATAKVLYVANLPAGKTMTVSARRIWLRLGSASSVNVTVNGRPVGRGLAGVVDLVLKPHGVAGHL
jgi:RodZ C-terminal domain